MERQTLDHITIMVVRVVLMSHGTGTWQFLCDLPYELYEGNKAVLFLPFFSDLHSQISFRVSTETAWILLGMMHFPEAGLLFLFLSFEADYQFFPS